MEAESRGYDPWGRGGCGAPLRDPQGKLLTDLRQMYRENEAAWQNPETSERRARVPTMPELRHYSPLPPINTGSGFSYSEHPGYSTGSVFADQQTGLHWGQYLAEGRGPWAEEAGSLSRDIRTTRLGRVEPVERRAPPTYQEELEQQIYEKRMRRRLEKEERDRADAKMEAESRGYDPWGRGGCGAPLRDPQGKLLTDLRQMYRENEAAWRNPERAERRARVTTMPEQRHYSLLPPINTGSGFSYSEHPGYSTGSMFADQQTGLHWGQYLAEGRGPWAEEAGSLSRDIRTTRLGRVEPVERRAPPTYQEELEQQIYEKRMRKRLEKEERDRADAKMEAESRGYDPWGRGGCGAPLRDPQGKLLTDLRQMYRENEAAWQNPETSERRARVPTMPELRHYSLLPPINTGSGFSYSEHPGYSTGSVFADQQTGLHWGQYLAEGRGPWAEEAGSLSRDIMTTRLGRVEPVERRAPPTYQEELEQQIYEKRMRRRLEKEERDRADAKMEAESRGYDPWGRGGCSAPLRDPQGKLLTDLRQMYRENEAAWQNPETSERRARVTTMPEQRHYSPLPPNNTGSGVQTSNHVRGSVFSNQPTPQYQSERTKYMADLKQQIEEKRRQQAEEREKIRLEDEKDEKRLARQRALMQREYQEEQERKRCPQMEVRRKKSPPLPTLQKTQGP